MAGSVPWGADGLAKNHSVYDFLWAEEVVITLCFEALSQSRVALWAAEAM